MNDPNHNKILGQWHVSLYWLIDNFPKGMKYIVSIIIALSFLTSCKENEPDVKPSKATLKITFDTRWQDQDFAMEQVYYDNFDHRIRVDKFMSYISKLGIENSSSNFIELKDFYLADFSSDPTFTFEVDPGTYNKLMFGLGIPEAYNKNQDPAQYPSSSPLSVAGSLGMFWYWDTGYIFTKFEGKADLSGTEGEPLLDPYIFHLGADTLYRRMSFNNLAMNLQAGDTKTLTLKIQVDQLLGTGDVNDIDIATENITHSNNSMELAIKVADNYANAITVEQ